MKKHVRCADFLKRIAEDFNVSTFMEYTLKLPADKREIKNFTRGVAHQVRIFDGKTENDYMISQSVRDDFSLAKGTELRWTGLKPLGKLIHETGAEVIGEKCRICEGGGWTSEGMRYTYGDIYCEE